MITCKHATQLFDRFLDDELSPSLQAELHAHQINCSACQGELAMLEACGDVVKLDRCEPVVDAAFTDRVVLAYRSRRVIRPGRWFGRTMMVALPMAAAASIALTATLILPTVQPAPSKTAILSDREAVPTSVERALSAATDTDKSPEAARALADTPRMSSVNFMDTLLEPVVGKALSTLNGARAGMDQLELLLQAGWSDSTEKLAAEWRSNRRDGGVGDAGPDATAVDPTNPAHLNRPLPADSATDDAWEAL